MSKFHEAVDSLLGAFTHVISLLDTQRVQRKKLKEGTDPTRAVAEENLKKSLKASKDDVKKAYERDVKKFGDGFKAGDEQAHSSLSSILHRLNAGFLSLISRFTSGRSTAKDYQVLLNLSNNSRIEAIRTFEQLSYRLSQSSLELVPAKRVQSRRSGNGNGKNMPRRAQKSTSSSSLAKINSSTQPKKSQSRSNSNSNPKPKSEVSITAEGWVRSRSRPKTRRKTSSTLTSKSSPSSSSPPRNHFHSPKAINPNPNPNPPYTALTPRIPPTPQQPELSPNNRKSIMSFASDSTKLGEIPERKWARRLGEGEGAFQIMEYYPLAPYVEPVKEKSRFRRIFGRGG